MTVLSLVRPRPRTVRATVRGEIPLNQRCAGSAAFAAKTMCARRADLCAHLRAHMRARGNVPAHAAQAAQANAIRHLRDSLPAHLGAHAMRSPHRSLRARVFSAFGFRKKKKERVGQ